MPNGAVSRSRRALLRGKVRQEPPPGRPPWAVADFEDECTRCGACLEACPQGILTWGEGGFPEVDFERGTGECTFCAACVEACPEPAFDPTRSPPWSLTARIGEDCLAKAGVHCQTCGDACPWQAIRFIPRIGGPPLPQIEPEACTGCGACQAVCPSDAVRVLPAMEAEHG